MYSVKVRKSSLTFGPLCLPFSHRRAELFGTVGWKKKPLEDRESNSRVSWKPPRLLFISRQSEVILWIVACCMYVALLRHEGEMYKSLLNDYEVSQRTLVLENAELKKVLQQMKKEMIHILSPRKPSPRGATADDSQEQVCVCVCVHNYFYHLSLSIVPIIR